MFAIGKHHERGFFPVEKFFDNDFLAGIAKNLSNQDFVNDVYGILDR